MSAGTLKATDLFAGCPCAPLLLQYLQEGGRAQGARGAQGPGAGARGP